MNVDSAKMLCSAKTCCLKGSVTVPGDKSISHRALMLGATAIGETAITGLLESEDVLNTAKAMAALGARIERYRDGTWKLRGCGVGGYSEPADIIDFGNSGTGVRLCAGLVATTAIKTAFTGDESLNTRPMGRITDPLRLFGATIDTRKGGRLPMRIKGAKDPIPVEYVLPVASAQVKSAILLAGLNVPGKTTIIEPVATRDHTEKMLAGFGADISISEKPDGRHITVQGCKELKACAITVPGDPSSAAFLIVAALITDNSEITIENMMLNPSRIGLVTTLMEMGADIKISNRRIRGGEEMGDITVRSSSLEGITVPADRAPSMIDEYPVLAIAASFAKGLTRMEGVGELRVKESDRLAVVSQGLTANGVTNRTGSDWMEIEPGNTVTGGATVKTSMDHRIAMAFLVMGAGADKPVCVDDGAIIDTSFPGFADLMNSLGCKINNNGNI